MSNKPSKDKNSACDMTHIYDTIKEHVDILANEQFQKELLNIQHQNNLEIHEKQSGLVRELNEKQAKTTITIAYIAGTATILAALLGASFGFYLKTTIPQASIQQTTKV